MHLYREEASDPLYNAQRNLSWRTHYVEDHTLRVHCSRVIHSEVAADGLLFAIVESVAIDPGNTRRGYRAVVFDLFGTVLTRASLDEARKSKVVAMADLRDAVAAIDAIEHTRKAIEQSRRYHAQELARLSATLKEMHLKRVAA